MRPVHIYNLTQEIPVYVTVNVDETKVNIKSIIGSLRVIIPSVLYEDALSDVWIGKFEMLNHKKVDSTYADGSIIISSDYINHEEDAKRRLTNSLVHELGHAFEVAYNDDLYLGPDISQIEVEFQDKKQALFQILEDKGYSPEPEWLLEDEYNREFDMFLKDEVGYANFAKEVEDIIVDPYAFTSKSEYVISNFQYYFLGRKSRVQEYSPEVYNFLEKIVNQYT